VRWNDLFDDLEGSGAAMEQAERRLEIADRTRAEVARVLLLNRLRASEGRHLTVYALGAVRMSGRLDRVGADWLLLACPVEVLVPLGAVARILDLPPEAVSPAGVGVVASRLSLGSALRAIAVDRARVAVALRDGTTLAGTPDRVGADFVDIAQHDDIAPRVSGVTSRTTIPYAAISTITRDPAGW
jgi:hypothetical protein